MALSRCLQISALWLCVATRWESWGETAAVNRRCWRFCCRSLHDFLSPHKFLLLLFLLLKISLTKFSLFIHSIHHLHSCILVFWCLNYLCLCSAMIIDNPILVFSSSMYDIFSDPPNFYFLSTWLTSSTYSNNAT